MTWEEYVVEAKRTMSDPPTQMDLAVRTLGLVGEWGEFLLEPGIEEAGDVLWYVAAIGQFVEYSAAQRDWEGHLWTPAHPGLDTHVFMIAEYVKKHIGHNKTLPKSDICYRLSLVLTGLLNFLPRHITMSDVAEHNVKKLRERWPEGFKP